MAKMPKKIVKVETMLGMHLLRMADEKSSNHWKKKMTKLEKLFQSRTTSRLSKTTTTLRMRTALKKMIKMMKTLSLVMMRTSLKLMTILLKKKIKKTSRE